MKCIFLFLLFLFLFAVFNSSLLNGKMIYAESARAEAFYMGVVRFYMFLEVEPSRGTFTDICTAFLISKYVAASAGSCIIKIKHECESKENSQAMFERSTRSGIAETSYIVESVRHFNDFKKKHPNVHEYFDVGLLMVSLFISVLIL